MRVWKAAVASLVAVAASGAPALAQQPGADMPIMRPDTRTYVVFDELEYLATGGDGAVEYDADLWWGGDIHRIWFRAAGEQSTGSSEGDTRLEAMYSRAVTPFWNLQFGPRLDHRYGESDGTRAHLGLGFAGLARYWFEVEAFAYLSEDGDASARVEASYDILLTQRLALESEVEGQATSRTRQEWGIGSGVSDIELGARLRYEFRREFAPYIGVSWERALGRTADLARDAGSEPARASLVVGLHWWW
jgi:copper resistance protein B